MTLPGNPESYWIATTAHTDYPPLDGGLRVDVAILGGGIAGITAATVLKEAGAKVAVVEAHRVLEGVTGHTTAKVTAQHGLKYHDLKSRVGHERAQLYGAANLAAVEFIAGAVASRRIDCDFRRISACTFGESPQQLQSIEQEVEAEQALGLPAQFVSDAGLPFATVGAVCLADQALFHPRRYLLHLAQAIPGDGSYVFENTRALDVEESTPVTVRTSRGPLKADNVIVATHFPFLDRGLYFTRLQPWRSYVLAMRLRGEVPQSLLISPKPGYHSIRPHPTADGWIVLIGGQEHVTGHGGDTVARYRAVEEWARGHFDVEAIDYRWSTQDNYSVDGLPFAGKYTPASSRLYVASGFGGWGMTNATAAAMVVTNTILGRDNPWEAAYNPGRLDQLTSVGRFVEGGLTFAQHFAGSRLSSAHKANPASIARGEGEVIEVDGKKVAFYADEGGVLHAVSPFCGHQGCMVTWNSAEKSWDCPCHGSRYRATGEFIHGPTVKDLAPVRIEAMAGSDAR
ncbi:MAG: FAD-dependent oxidoreductase [Anaerolineae bacterium]